MAVLKDTKRLEGLQAKNKFWTIGQFDERIMCRMMGYSSAKVCAKGIYDQSGYGVK